MKAAFYVAVTCFVIGLTAQADAAPIIVSDTVTGFADLSNGAPNPFVISFSSLPTAANGDGILTLSMYGDFDYSEEWVEITLDGNVIGRLWDWNSTNNGLFVTNPGDFGNQYMSVLNAIATIPASQLNAYLADGTVNVGFSFGSQVTNLSDNPNEFVTAQLAFDSAEVPEPASLALWSLMGVAGLTTWRRRKLAKSST